MTLPGLIDDVAEGDDVDDESACRNDGHGCGVSIESRECRPLCCMKTIGRCYLEERVS